MTALISCRASHRSPQFLAEGRLPDQMRKRNECLRCIARSTWPGSHKIRWACGQIMTIDRTLFDMSNEHDYLGWEATFPTTSMYWVITIPSTRPKIWFAYFQYGPLSEAVRGKLLRRMILLPPSSESDLSEIETLDRNLPSDRWPTFAGGGR